MISRQHRFHGRRGLKFVYQKGRTVRNPHFAIKTILNPHRKSYRLAVVVSRKVEKSAVGRNRLRRRLYAAVQAVEPEITGPFDMVLTVFSNQLSQEPPSSLNKQLYQQLKAAGVVAKKATSKK